jgi:hypothetical protein
MRRHRRTRIRDGPPDPLLHETPRQAHFRRHLFGAHPFVAFLHFSRHLPSVINSAHHAPSGYFPCARSRRRLLRCPGILGQWGCTFGCCRRAGFGRRSASLVLFPGRSSDAQQEPQWLAFIQGGRGWSLNGGRLGVTSSAVESGWPHAHCRDASRASWAQRRAKQFRVSRDTR